MKKLLIICIIAFGVFGCGVDPYGPSPGPEDYPVIDAVTMTPESPVDREYVTVRAIVSCAGEIRSIGIMYYFDGEIESRKAVGVRDLYGNELITYNYEGMIPGQRAGSIVCFYVYALGPKGTSVISQTYQYPVALGANSEN